MTKPRTLRSTTVQQIACLGVSADRRGRDSSVVRVCSWSDMVALLVGRARAGKAKVWQAEPLDRKLLPDPSLRLRSLGARRTMMRRCKQCDSGIDRYSVSLC
jgi:hypothetical protein